LDGRALRWGLLGTARINRRLIPPLRASRGNRLVAVASRDLARGEAYAREWGIDRVHGSYQALLDDPDVDVVYVPLPNHLHAEWSIRAARAGKHVLCEKPLALSVGEVDAMEQAARAAGVVLAEGFMYRHHPQTLRARELVAAGEIGDVRFVRGTFSFTLARPDDFRLRREWGGGSLWDVGGYPLGFTQFLLDAAPVEVFGSRVEGATGVDETFAAQLVFPDGVLAQVDCGFRSRYRAEMEVVGTRGTLLVSQPWNPDPARPLLLHRGDDVVEVAVPETDRVLAEIEDLEACARTGRAPRLPVAESRRNVRTITALLQSAREGRPVRP
jgi:predicted dehydrogenase